MIKRIFRSLELFICTLLCLTLLINLSSKHFVFAEGTSYIESPWIYQIENNEISIVGYTGNSSECYVPWELAGKEVKNIENLDNANVKKLHVPNNGISISENVSNSVNSIVSYNLADNISATTLYGDEISSNLTPTQEDETSGSGENDDEQSSQKQEIESEDVNQDSKPISNDDNANRDLSKDEYNSQFEEIEDNPFEEREDDPFKEENNPFNDEIEDSSFNETNTLLNDITNNLNIVKVIVIGVISVSVITGLIIFLLRKKI